jgi:hypothetical protein
MFVKSMRGKVGILSSMEITKGTRNMNYYYHYYMSHYNARKRVYTRRQDESAGEKVADAERICKLTAADGVFLSGW